MTKKTLKKCVTLENIKGLHARAAAKFVKVSCSFKAEAQVRVGEMRVSGSSIMGLLMLGAIQGSKIELQTSGPEAKALMTALQELIDNKFNEEA
jgi:phosphocarrier protein HPr